MLLSNDTKHSLKCTVLHIIYHHLFASLLALSSTYSYRKCKKYLKNVKHKQIKKHIHQSECCIKKWTINAKAQENRETLQVHNIGNNWWYTSVSNNNPVSHDSVTLSQDVQFQDPETEADKWNASIIQFIFLYL